MGYFFGNASAQFPPGSLPVVPFFSPPFFGLPLPLKRLRRLCFFLGLLVRVVNAICRCIAFLFLLPPCFSRKKRSRAELAAAASAVIVGATIEPQPHCTAFKLSFPSFPLLVSFFVLRRSNRVVYYGRAHLQQLHRARLSRAQCALPALWRRSMCSVPFKAGFVFYFSSLSLSRSGGIRRFQRSHNRGGGDSGLCRCGTTGELLLVLVFLFCRHLFFRKRFDIGIAVKQQFILCVQTMSAAFLYFCLAVSGGLRMSPLWGSGPFSRSCYCGCSCPFLK